MSNIVCYSFTGLCSEYGEIKTKIVLAGDPKQLSAVIKSKNAAQLGLKTSWMEKLMTKKCYQLHARLKRYNPHFITVLTKNYWSHPAILAVPTELFYDGMLIAEGNKGITCIDILKKN